MNNKSEADGGLAWGVGPKNEAETLPAGNLA